MIDWLAAVEAAKRFAAFAGVALIIGFAVVLGRARGEEAMRTGSGVICDTAEQVKAVILNKRVDVRQAIAEVNAGIQNPHACGLLTIVFVPVAKVGEVAVSAGVYDLTEITIIGALDEGTWRTVKPIKQFTAIFRKAQDI